MFIHFGTFIFACERQVKHKAVKYLYTGSNLKSF